MFTFKVYVGTYGKYNAGSIAGKWLNIFDYDSKEEFLTACGELHADDPDPEFMFQDYDDEDGLKLQDTDMFGESWIDPKVWELAEELEENFKPYLIYCAHVGGADVDNFEDAFSGEVDFHNDDHKAAGEYFADELGAIEIPDHIAPYFDYEAYGRDCMYDYFVSGGYLFRNV